jgi:lipopolysaccharide transport system ATP-binding protein
VINLTNIGKCYSLRTDKAFLLRDFLLGLVGRSPKKYDFWALRGVSLSVGKGEALAVIGRNGAGKSTLLGLIAGTIYPTEGTVKTSGRICALLELGAGFHPDLTGRENIYLNAALLGLTEDQVKDKFDRIVEFAELWQFIDQPISKYSSGMSMRLGFSVAIHIEPEILIIDEAISAFRRNAWTAFCS